MNNGIIIEAAVMKAASYALQQNYIPVIRNITVTNESGKTLENLVVKVSSDPQFTKEYSTVISSLETGKSVEIAPVPLVVSTDLLFSLTEKTAGNVTISVIDGEDVIAENNYDIDVLAYDEWTGARMMPELIAAFVLPNTPKTNEIISKASLWLQKWSGSPAFTGYQSKNPNTVKQQAAAVYAALQAENIAYTMPPSSYEKSGQRVRLPHNVLTEKHGTCLDLSLLYASCLELIGLNPLIVFTKGHAFCGVWLEEETFPNCVEDDVSSVTKRAASGIDELCLVECTDFTAGKSVDFNNSEKHASDNLKDAEDFLFAVDIMRCRGSGIRPIAVRIAEDGVYKAVDYGKRDKNDITAAPKEIDTALHGASAQPTELTRQMIWERKLLDLSLRNSLINFRPTSSNVQLMTDDLAKLEDVIYSGNSFKILPAPNEISLKLTDSKIFEAENEKDMVSAIAENELRSKRIRTFTKEADLERILKKLHRQAKLSLEENGANTLYLALGFLRWFETEKSEKPRYAPLILVPVDIVRRIQDKSYSLRIRDEDTQMNITLLELLRQDYGISINSLDPLPEDESGVDMKLVFNTVRQGIMSQKHWDIEEIAFLGQFSFSRFIMWNDLRNRSEDLKKNKVVKSLISGKTEWEPEIRDLSPNMLDETVSPADMAIPTSVDSSQLAAVCEAAAGESFVLHGPPGTGKSQTITNMIANALFQGKSVLFVAEKMAALSVVQKRLEKIGLAPFCLELHSNKAQKRAVLNQLENTLATGHIKSPEEYSATAEKLSSLRKELNETMKALYLERAAGMSVYDAITAYESNKISDGLIVIDKSVLASSSSETYEKWLEAAGDVCAVGKELGGFNNSPLRNVRTTTYSIEIRERFAEAAKNVSSAAKSADEAYGKLGEKVGLPMPSDRKGISSALSLLKRITAPEIILSEIITSDNSDAYRDEIEKLISDGDKCAAIRSELGDKFENSVWDYDCDKAIIEWKKAQQSWFIGKAIGSNKQVKELSLYAKEPNYITKDNISEILGKLSDYKKLKASLSTADGAVTSLFGLLWRGENTDFGKLKGATDEAFEIKALLSSGTDSLRSAALSIIGNNNTRSEIKPLVLDSAEKFLALLEASDSFDKEFSVDTPESADFFGLIENTRTDFAENAEQLRDRAALETKLEKLAAIGLGGAAESYRLGKVTESNITSALICAVSMAVISEATASEPLLASFHGTDYEHTIEKYRNFSARFEELTINELVARLSAKIPDASSGAAGSSELAVLQKAIKSGGRMMPIRKLFDSIPNLLRRICPCMLMSPISVAQYIDTSFPKFDLVIFDEASQLPTSEAVGAIARGENVVVVGDPKQLPPTSFFSANQTDEENYDIEDLESVLDDCLALGIPSKHLLWHYRSRHESLIAYSNSRFYDNSLRTFPSPDDLVSKVTWVHVDGYYDKGGTKQNKAEAEAVTAEVVRRLSDPELRKDSIGIVTFNIVQQILIDDMIAEEFRKNPELEQYANEMYEPILVKNLENVQGDERDVILFSIGYGPDKDGKVSMNFGPVNQDGGWRRLNVAISRARKQMTVYSVITPEQIDLSRTRSDGVAGLKGFLEFAAKGSSALPARQSSAAKKENDFAKTIAAELENLGYSVRRSVGCSDYKVDIGVIDPENDGRYILGIVCESRNNFSITTARDRNIVQPSVLKGLGWKITNVHILDWLDNEKKVIERLKQEIETAKNASDAPEETENKAGRMLSFEKEEPKETLSPSVEYVSYIPEEAGDSEYYLDNSSTSVIKRIIAAVTETEAPVSRKVIYKYVLSSFGITRSLTKYETRFDEVFSSMELNTTESREAVFVWKDGQSPENMTTYRTGKKRQIEDIPPEEIGAAIAFVLSSAISIERAELIKETAKLFGFSRTTESIELNLSLGIQRAVKSGKAKVDTETGRIMLA